ncbi:MAG: rRNA maturation RNase YbeY [Patulibacter sp.]
MMFDIEVEGRERAAGAPTDATIREALQLAFASAGLHAGHVAIHFVDETRSHQLAAEYLGKDDATDVISFPVDEDHELGPTIAADIMRELGDIIICPERTHDLLEAIIHGALHLVGMDHETDDGEMLALQGELVSWLR